MRGERRKAVKGPASSVTVRAATALEIAALPALLLEWETPGAGSDATTGELVDELTGAAGNGGVLVATIPAQASGTKEARVVGVVVRTASADALDSAAFVTRVAVDPAWRRMGIATGLLEAAVGGSSGGDTRRDVAAVAEPGDAVAIALLCRVGFHGTEYLEDYAGPGQGRIYFERALNEGYNTYSSPILIPATRTQALRACLKEPDRRLLRAVDLAHGVHYEIITVTPADESAFMANEIAVGVGFAGALLAALAFLFGFVLATGTAPPDVLGVIGSCVAITTLSLVAYANGSGELARLRSGEFDRTMIVANILSEFAGVYPIFIVTPAVVVAATDASAASLILALSSGLALVLYMRLRFDLVRRYARTHARAWAAYRYALALLPLAATVCWRSMGALWPWTVATTILLFVGAAACMRAGAEELEPGGPGR